MKKLEALPKAERAALEEIATEHMLDIETFIELDTAALTDMFDYEEVECLKLS